MVEGWMALLRRIQYGFIYIWVLFQREQSEGTSQKSCCALDAERIYTSTAIAIPRKFQ